MGNKFIQKIIKRTSRDKDVQKKDLEFKNNVLVGFVMMSKEDKNNYFVLFINFKFKNKAFENMNSSFSRKFVSKGFIVMRVKNDLINLFVKNFSKQGISSSCFFNSSLTDWHEIRDINHFSDSRNFAEASCPIGVSFNALFNSSTCSGLGGSSSTGCQSIFSQNSQSSSVTSFVSSYLLDMSCFINRTTALVNNSESNFNSLSLLDLSSCILTENDKDYLSFSVVEKNINSVKYNLDSGDFVQKIRTGENKQK